MNDQGREAQGPVTELPALPFRAVLTPYRSLSPRGFVILMVAVSAVSFVAGLAFALMGAWPVFGFFGLDVGLIYLAFRLNYRSGRLYETVEVSPSRLTIQRVYPSGKTEGYEFPSYWARVELSQGHDGRSHLRVGSHGQEVTFGDFLTDEERASLADEMRAAIRTARQPAF
jgi:uncharacterized membrane protein